MHITCKVRERDLAHSRQVVLHYLSYLPKHQQQMVLLAASRIQLHLRTNLPLPAGCYGYTPAFPCPS